MAKDNKFGTFGGVYTPSLLTILGVIMYLRLPWVVGHAGLVGAVSIILVAHVISIATGLSISSIATDKNVGAGGPYYIVSRSLGLPIGGALGVALFIGLCFSTSLYVIGFSESLLDTFDIERTPTSIRISGSLVLTAITAVTIISTAFAIKTQYVVLALIALSLGAIFMGDPGASPVQSSPAAPSPSIALLFGIFFPAVTGFTAGVNMSGDLKDPKRAIPRGTMAAIFSGLLVYLALAVFLSLRVPKGSLIGDSSLLANIAFKGLGGWLGPGLVVAGIWGATFSSGLGSIMGAPRILQALSIDHITPQHFAKGKGPEKEPRNALVLAFLIAEAGILIADLDVIARVVSMVFLSMYAFLNICCAIEAKVSPDFRPSFRIPASISVVGAATCIVIMIQLDLLAMLGASALMVGLFVSLQRKQLKLESGDAWEGIWSSMVRSALYQVASPAQKQQRNWRPNILAFRVGQDAVDSYEEFAQALITGNGILTDFSFDGTSQSKKGEHEGNLSAQTTNEENRKKRPEKVLAQEQTVGLFRRELPPEGSPFETIQTLCQHYGFSGLEPNALLLPWSLQKRNPRDFAATIETAAHCDFNILAYKHVEDLESTNRIDIWWQADAGNVAFCIALLRFLTRASMWESAELRFILVSSDSTNNDNLRSTMRRLLRDGRVDATVKIVNDSFGDRNFVDRVRHLSGDAALTVLGLPNRTGELNGPRLEEFGSLSCELGRVLLVRGSSSFAEVLPIGRSAMVSELPPPLEGDEQAPPLPSLTLSHVSDIAAATTAYSEAYQHLTGRLSERCMKKLYGRHIELIRALRATAQRHLTLEISGKLRNPRRLRTAFNRQQSAFLMECRTLLSAFSNEELPDLHSVLEGGIDAFLNDDAVVSEPNATLEVKRRRKDFLPDPKDSSQIRSFKRRRRISSWLFRRTPQYPIPIASLQRFYFQKAKTELLFPAVQGFVTESHQVMVQIGKLLNSSRIAMPIEKEELELSQLFDAQRERLCQRLDDLGHSTKVLAQRQNWALIVGALEISQKYADDIGGFDFKRLVRTSRIPTEKEDSEELRTAPALWTHHQKLLGERAQLALSLSGVQHRLTAIVGRERESLAIGLKNGALTQCEQVLEGLEQLTLALPKGPSISQNLNLHIDTKNHFDPQAIVARLVQECAGSSDELPVSVKTLSDESIQALEEGRSDAIEEVELPVRRLMQFLTETELIGGLSESLEDVPRQEQQALGIAQDVVRLVHFQLSELEGSATIDNDEFLQQMSPVVSNGIERLSAERDALSSRTPRLLAQLDKQLHLVVDGTNAYELSGQSARLDQHIRAYHGKKAVSGARGILRRAMGRARDTTVKLLYRRSEGVLLAQQRRGTLKSQERAVDRVGTMVRDQVAKPEVLGELPFYYRQLFFGQSGVNDTFWVGRNEQLLKAKQALTLFDSGSSGCVLLVGDRLSGKSALLQRLSSDLFSRRKVFRVHPPPGGSIDPRKFECALRKSLGSELESTTDTGILGTVATLALGSVVLLDDLNLWWERSEQGLRLLEEIVAAIHAHGSRVLFVLAIETQAFRLINRLLPLSDTALSVLECGPLPAEALKKIVTLRHTSTGLKYHLGRQSEDTLGEVRLARLFSQHFENSKGSVGGTLRSWISSIKRVKGDVLEIGAPNRRDWEALDCLRDSWVALLLQIALHKQMSVDRLRRVSGLPLSRLKDDLDALIRMGLVIESQRRILEIEPAIYTALTERFIRRGIFA